MAKPITDETCYVLGLSQHAAGPFESVHDAMRFHQQSIQALRDRGDDSDPECSLYFPKSWRTEPIGRSRRQTEQPAPSTQRKTYSWPAGFTATEIG